MQNIMLPVGGQYKDAYGAEIGNINLETLNFPLPDNDEFQKYILHYQQMVMLFDSALKFITMRLDLIEKECAAKGWHVPIHTVTSQIKSPVSINKKLQALGAPRTIQSVFDFLHDVAGVRVVCGYLSDIYSIRA